MMPHLNKNKKKKIKFLLQYVDLLLEVVRENESVEKKMSFDFNIIKRNASCSI